MRILSIDHGDKKIGLAICDESETVARPLKVLIHKSRADDAGAVAEIARAEGAEKIVIGLPRDDDGAEGHQARKVRRWAEALGEVCQLPIDFWDESYSTAEASSIQRASGKRRKKSEPDDAIAAAVILQSYLDARVKET